jgi:protein-ribulosamine 3-kinase
MVDQIPRVISSAISHKLNCTINAFDFVSGGCINHGGRIETSKGVFFLKWNTADKYPGMFQAEAEGLNLLRANSSLRIPSVIASDRTEGFQFLILECISHAKRSKKYWEDLGEQLAALHKKSSNQFGLASNNYIGSLPQRNNFHGTWLDFFREERLMPQVELAFDQGKIGSDIVHEFDKLYTRLPDLVIEDNPSLLHGDLWSGNLIVDELGNPCLIDPAVYYGNREMELAFTQLFGGFDPAFYSSYEANFPMEDGFKSRIDLYNLYPLLVHVNLFGGGYVRQVVSILRDYV